MAASAHGQVVVITGASAGIGRATARRFAEDGARIALIARGRDGLDAAAREVEELGGEALVIACDVSDAEAVERAAAQIEERLGPIDIWINNAMVTVFSPVMEMEAADFRRVMEVTYLGYVHGTLAALRRMKPRDHGTIIQVGSALAYRGIPLQSAYCAAKHAIQGFMDSLHAELLHDRSRVHVTMVQMPACNTPQFRWSKSRMPRKAQPVPPIFQPEVCAEAIHHAAFHHKREHHVAFSSTQAIVGNKVVPGLADRYLARTGYESQMIDEPEDPYRPDNLYQPLPGDHGAHGPYDDKAKERSWQLSMRRHKGMVGGGAALGLAALASAWFFARRN